MSSGERPMGAAKGTQSDTEALCNPPPFSFTETPLFLVADVTSTHSLGIQHHSADPDVVKCYKVRQVFVRWPIVFFGVTSKWTNRPLNTSGGAAPWPRRGQRPPGSVPWPISGRPSRRHLLQHRPPPPQPLGLGVDEGPWRHPPPPPAVRSEWGMMGRRRWMGFVPMVRPVDVGVRQGEWVPMPMPMPPCPQDAPPAPREDQHGPSAPAHYTPFKVRPPPPQTHTPPAPPPPPAQPHDCPVPPSKPHVPRPSLPFHSVGGAHPPPPLPTRRIGPSVCSPVSGAAHGACRGTQSFALLRVMNNGLSALFVLFALGTFCRM